MENNGTEKIGLVTPTPGLYDYSLVSVMVWYHVIIDRIVRRFHYIFSSIFFCPDFFLLFAKVTVSRVVINALTHWRLADVAVILKYNFESLSHSLRNCSQVNATKPCKWEINIDSGNGLMLSGKQQAIAEANVDPDLCCHMVLLGHNKLINLRSYKYPHVKFVLYIRN